MVSVDVRVIWSHPDLIESGGDLPFHTGWGKSDGAPA